MEKKSARKYCNESAHFCDNLSTVLPIPVLFNKHKAVILIHVPKQQSTYNGILYILWRKVTLNMITLANIVSDVNIT